MHDSSTQLFEEDIIPFDTRVQPVVQDLVHEVLNRAVFAIEQERDLQRITAFKEKYRSLREGEELKLSNAKREFLIMSRKTAVHESALKKVLSIRLARETVESVVASVISRPSSTPLVPPSRLDQLIDLVVPQIVVQAHEVVDVMRRIRNERNTVGNTEATFHTNTCVH